ncbi:helix-turn-helix domain-containing protein [Geminocystis sp. NIES-3708]|uniref:helix-turn-helix domain-containing protein n=1 Tax=Geminocystis sp. NIES-3708 TaxID=1615909 RepID=UPI001187598C|nr:helix-turn-helix domain-containing protein [Geminocystis sp. NIES-3708]
MSDFARISASPHILAMEVARKKFKLPPVRKIDESLIYQDYPTLKLSKKDVNNIIELIEGGFSVKEIAEAYDVTESTIRYHLQRRNQKIA